MVTLIPNNRRIKAPVQAEVAIVPPKEEVKAEPETPEDEEYNLLADLIGF